MELILPRIVDPKTFKNQWLDISTEAYHADKTSANFSSLKHMLRSPAKYLHHLQKPSEPSKQMKYGTIAHMALLESEKFKSLYVVEPEFTGLTATGELTTSKNAKDVQRQIKEWRASLAPGAIVITTEELESLTGIINSMLGNPRVLAAIKNGIPELKGTWVDPDTGIVCRMQIDLWMELERWLLDVKTTGKSAEWDIFRRSVELLHYDMQIAMYYDGVEAITGKPPNMPGWIVPETHENHEMEIHLTHDLYLEVGRWKYKSCLKRLKKCIQTGHFPQRQQEVDIQMPEPSPYYFKNYEGVTRE